MTSLAFRSRRRERLEDLARQREVAREDREELGAREDDELAVGERRAPTRSASRPARSAISPKKSPGLQVRQHDLAAVGRVDEDLDLATEDDEEEVSRLGLPDDRRARRDSFAARPRGRALRALRLRAPRRGRRGETRLHQSRFMASPAGKSERSRSSPSRELRAADDRAPRF